MKPEAATSSSMAPTRYSSSWPKLVVHRQYPLQLSCAEFANRCCVGLELLWRLLS
jgi:hypothetical protein